MSPWSLIINTILITSSGALSPGPLTAATLIVSLREGSRAGLKVATGHMAFELPFVVLLALAFERISEYLSIWYVHLGLTLLMATFMLYFAVLAYRSVRNVSSTEASSKEGGRFGNPFVIGVILTGLNPYFLLWWATVGLALINMSLALGMLSGIIIMYASHVWMDFAWLTLLSSATARGKRILGSRGYRILMVALSTILLFYAVWMIVGLALG